MQNKIVIGIVGPFGSGKSTVARFIKDQGFDHIILSDFICEELVKSKKIINRENLQNMGNILREKNGANILAKYALEKAKKSHFEKLVIDGIRNIAEIEFLSKKSRCFIIGINSNDQLRFKRLQKAAKGFANFEDFKKYDAKDRGLKQTSTGLQVDACWEKRDFEVWNNGNFIDLKKQIIKITNLITRPGLRIIILGPPGSGKGTQAELLAYRFNLARLSVGALIRNQYKQKTSLGLEAAKYMVQGLAIPAIILIKMMTEWIVKHQQGFVIDNLVRSKTQLSEFKKFQRQYGLKLDKVFILEINESESIHRLHERKKYKSRPDEYEEAIHKRFLTYHESIAEITQYFKKQKLVCIIDAKQAISAIHREIMQNLI